MQGEELDEGASEDEDEELYKKRDREMMSLGSPSHEVMGLVGWSKIVMSSAWIVPKTGLSG